MPDAPSSAYQLLVPQTSSRLGLTENSNAIYLGQRNLEWLKYMNSFRTDEQKLRFTKPGDLKGIPIEAAKSYNVEIIQTEHETLKNTMPPELAKVLYSKDPFPKNPTVDEATYVLWANKVDKNYQTAVRWQGMSPYLSELEMRREGDLRGYYFLSQKTENVESVLRSLHTLPAEQKTQIEEWLLQMCQNQQGVDSGCDSQVKKLAASKTAYEFYLKYLPNSQELWNSYFQLENPRSEITWNSTDAKKMTVPFKDPSDNIILNFLKVNIQDEWKWNGWQLFLDFRPQADVHVEFQPGVTPHVNGLGGNTIVMDNNAPLSEWDVQWTIRHEFGHVLGFLDCYLEFYEPSTQAIVSYQLDITNLMCSRAGRFKQTHFDTLKNNYFK